MGIILVQWDKDILYRIKDSLNGIGGNITSINHSNTRKKGVNTTDSVVYVIQNQKDYQELMDFLGSEEKNRDWINYWSGFICAEGCFMIELYKSLKHKYDFGVTPSFTVGQKDIKMLNKLKNFLGYGMIYYNKNSNIWEIHVKNLLDCLKTAELFTGYIHNVKYHDFVMWKHVLGFIRDKKHLTKEGILYVSKLKQGMNVSHKCKWTPEKIKEYWVKNDK